MTPPVKGSSADDPPDKLARLFALVIKRDRPLVETIVEMDGAGIKQSRIAILLGTSPDYVKTALKRSKKKR